MALKIPRRTFKFPSFSKARRACSKIGLPSVDRYSGEAPRRKIPVPLYYASLLGLDSIVSMLLGDTTLAALPPIGDRCYADILRQKPESFGSNENTVQMLLEKGVDVNAKGGRYGSALQAASAKGYDKIVQLLLEKGADVNAKGGCYGSALEAVSSRGYHNAASMPSISSAPASGSLYVTLNSSRRSTSRRPRWRK
ncbi:hypothetical protein EDB80DRAFT_176155 [Ilyonectria destructans]|nr:hypothetical protein EDB80DRAFT_176155 [Ilyonectria destructans]